MWTMMSCTHCGATLHRDRRERLGDAGLCAGHIARNPHSPPQICLPAVRNDGAGTGTLADHCRRLCDTGATVACLDQQILRSSSPVPAVADICPPGCRDHAFNTGRGGWAVPVGGWTHCTNRLGQKRPCLGLPICRRHTASSARAGPRQDQGPDGCGSMPATSGAGPVPIRLQ